jgi:hypothetical protein
MTQKEISTWGRQALPIYLLKDSGKRNGVTIEETIRSCCKRSISVEGIAPPSPAGKILPAAWRLNEGSASRGPGIYLSAALNGGEGVVIATTKSGKVFIGQDNGVLSLALGKEEVERAVRVTGGVLGKAVGGTGFSELALGRLTAGIADGADIGNFGTPIPPGELARIRAEPKAESSLVCGYVVDIGPKGEILTNIPNESGRSNTAVTLRLSTNLGGSVQGLFKGRMVLRAGVEEPQNGPAFFLAKLPGGCISILNHTRNAAKELGVEFGIIGLDTGLVPTVKVSMDSRPQSYYWLS